MPLRTTIVLMTMLPSIALADPDRAYVLMGSHHVDATSDFEEFNPGVFLMWEGLTVDTTVGVYQNSYGRVSVAATLSTEVLSWDDGAVSLFAGVAHYPENGRRFAIHAGDFVPMIGAQLRTGNLFLQVVPSDGVATDAIFSFGITYPFN